MNDKVTQLPRQAEPTRKVLMSMQVQLLEKSDGGKEVVIHPVQQDSINLLAQVQILNKAADLLMQIMAKMMSTQTARIWTPPPGAPLPPALGGQN